jgi:murein DD-endopeptidase MepM/ murein hydrolase activator NlpD
LTFKEKRKKSGGLVVSIILILVLAGAGYIYYFSPLFEQNKPTIQASDKIYWNLKSKLTVKLSDESGIKYYKITFKDGEREYPLNQGVLRNIEKNLSIDVTPPNLDMFYKGDDAVLEIEAVDNSKWNFLEGNKVVRNIPIKLDMKKPVANVLSNSRYIHKGGSAAVVVKVEDKNLKDFYVEFNGKKRFELLPFKKENYYSAIIGWPIDIEEFSRVNLVAIDKADNRTITKIPFYIQQKPVKVDKITLSESFIKNVSANVLEQSLEKVPQNVEDIFIYSNRDLRAKNLKTLLDVTQKSLSRDTLTESFSIKRFKRLRGSKTVANYGERRHYYLNGEKINEAWHLGIDWASVKKAPIRTSNKGEVVFKDYLGLYGNSIIINHGMGLFSLYAHTSSQDVEVGESVKAGQKIANTGATGGVFGDHLHFGILVQGVEVNPIEWMDKNWIKTRITDILKNGADQIK